MSEDRAERPVGSGRGLAPPPRRSHRPAGRQSPWDPEALLKWQTVTLENKTVARLNTKLTNYGRKGSSKYAYIEKELTGPKSYLSK